MTKLERRLSNQRGGAPGLGCLENTPSQSAGANGTDRWGEGSVAAVWPQSGPLGDFCLLSSRCCVNTLITCSAARQSALNVLVS